MSDPYFITVSLVVSFLGGGIVSAAINWVRTERADKKERKIKFLDDQLRKLYGPLYYFVSQSEKCFELNDRFHKAYNEEFIQEKWSKDTLTQERLRVRAGQTLELANQYIAEVKSNNHKIKEILDNNYSFIDPDDVDVFMLFNEHYLRFNKEIEESGKLITPDGIYEKIGDISFLRPDFIDRVKLKFQKKKTKLEDLLNK
ncbi:MAG: hypothetical protein A2Z47_07880 [Thermodesulfovibrio sp. RBG_19FT_COMBO_42_12]|nr:MAG: hypothetical protein A2Z47_07880 [Thermodesulfovibrio sp. RBG_19FT_COMBO_42_12]